VSGSTNTSVVFSDVGSTVKLHCPRTCQSDVLWAKRSVSGYEIIAVDGAVKPRYRTHYTVGASNNGSGCDLVINKTTSSHSGHYVCYDQHFVTEFNVTVLGRSNNILVTGDR